MKLAIPRQKRSFVPLVIFILFLGISGTVFHLATRSASAGVQGWDAGNIISDHVFTNKNTMNPGDIQAFLNSKVSHCDTWGEQTSEFGGGTRRQWAEARGYSPPYTCLKDYSQHGKSAAQIIYDAAQEFSINPQVIIVLLQKEQGLVTDTWPLSLQYRSATGYGCPDTAPCDAEYYGFTNQVRWAARMFRAILNNSPSWYTPYVLGNNYIQYSPDSSCGGSNVYIQNRSTQALYNYTPYQPNQAALDAGWGTVSCGAYGNRNFYLYFTTWFGSTQGAPFTSLDNPRWMETAQDVRKKNPWTKEATGSTIPEGTQLRFVDKIHVDGVWYLRTEHDRAHNLSKGIPQSSVREIPYSAITTPEYYMQLTTPLYKRIPSSGAHDTSSLPKAGNIYLFTSKITINGKEFYRTKYDTDHNLNKGFPVSRLTKPAYAAFDQPRYMEVKTPTNKVNPVTGAEHATTFAQGTQLKFTSKMLANGQWYYRTEADTTNDVALAIPANDLRNVPYQAVSPAAKWLRLKTPTIKTNPRTGQSDRTVAGGTQLKVAQQITVTGTTYYRTSYDAQHGIDLVLPVSSFEEIPYVALDTPRTIPLKTAAEKVDPKTGKPTGDRYTKGQSFTFTTKIPINGIWYLRTEFDTQGNFDKGFVASNLQL